MSTLQTSVNLKGGLSSDNTWSGTNTFNSNIPTTTLTPTLSSQFITKAYADSNYAGTGILSGSNTWTGTNAFNTNLPTSTVAPTTTSHLTNKAYVDLKAPLASPIFTGTVSGITKSMVGLGDVDNTTDLLKPVSDATTTALNLKASKASPTFTGTLTTAGLTASGTTSLQTTTINGLTATASTSLQGTTINGLTVTAPTSLQATTINGTCVNTGTLSTYGVVISTTNGLTTPILNLSDYDMGAYNGAIFQQNQNMTIRSWNSGTSEATNIYFTTMNTAHEQSSTMVLYNNAIHLNQPTTIAGETTISGMLGLGGVSGRRFQISESSGGITMYIEDSGNMYTAGTFASGNASVGTLECWGNITSREGIYMYPGKTLTANGPINAYSGLNVYTGSTTLQNTTINGTTTLNTNLNLCSGTTAPTTGQLGQRITGTIYFSVTSSFTSVLSTITLTPGTWIIDGQVSFQSSGGSYYQINQYTVAFSKNSLINSTGMAQKSIYAGSGVVALVGFSNIQYGQLFSENLQQVVSHTADTNYSLLLLMQYNGGSNVMSNVNSYFYATRIA